MDDTTAPITLRPASPTLEEGRVFARLLDQAAEGLYGMLLGRRAGDVIALAFTHPGHDLSYEHVTFAEKGGQIVGVAAGYTAEDHRISSDEPLEAAAGWRRHRMAILERLAGRLVRFMDGIPAGDYYLHALATVPEQRGTGVGSRLFGAVEDRARAAGSRRLALDVAAKNRDARRLYERLGMSAEAESPRWFGLPDTNVVRMTKPI